MSAPFPGYDVLAKWRTPSFDEKTRAVVAARLEPAPSPAFFSAEDFGLLQAVVDRILPQADRAEPIPVAAWIDARLASGVGEGYRNERMPHQDEAWRRGLAGIAAEAHAVFGRAFVALTPEQQDEILRRVQAGDVSADAWAGLDPKLFFRVGVLRTAAALYYTDPQAWSEIGFGGPASPRGYVRLGFDERDPWEAREGSR